MESIGDIELNPGPHCYSCRKRIEFVRHKFEAELRHTDEAPLRPKHVSMSTLYPVKYYPLKTKNTYYVQY